MSRLPPIVYEKLTPEQKKVYDKIVASEGSVSGASAIWLQTPELCDRLKDLNDFLMKKSSLKPYIQQAVALVVARKFNSRYLFSHHSEIALKAGLSKEIIDDINHDRKVVFKDEADQVVYDATVVLAQQKEISDELYGKCIKLFGLDTLTVISHIIGQYTLFSTILNAFDFPPEESTIPLA